MSTCPMATWDPFAEAVIDDPWPPYRELREAGGAVFLEQHDVWAISRHQWAPKTGELAR